MKSIKHLLVEGAEIGFRDDKQEYRIGCIKSILPGGDKFSVLLPMTGKVCFIHLVHIEEVIGTCSNIWLNSLV